MLAVVALDSVLPKRREDRGAGEHKNNDGNAAAHRGDRGVRDGRDGAVEDVRDTRTARNDDDEHSLHPTTHRIGSGLLQHRLSESAGDDIGSPADRQRCQSDDERGQPETGRKLE